LRYDQPLSAEELAKFKVSIKRRIKREPAAYIVGVREFWSMELSVTKDVLIPRPETECLVERALERLPVSAPDKASALNVLELGTGSGAVVLALAAERPGYRYFASDRSPKALRVARGNAKRHATTARIVFFAGNWFDSLKPRPFFFDMILSNPPYIATRVIGELEPEVKDFEPFGALDGGKDGLESIGHIVDRAPSYLKAGGYLILEIGHDQGQGVASTADAAGCYESAEIFKDYSGYDRVAVLKTKNIC
jgi:release factor glutamine methyltransferase